MTAQKWVSRLGGLATIVLLARLLEPEDFGVAAAAGALLPLVYVLSDVGFSTYIVQADSIDDRTLSTAFWFSLMSGVALAAIVFVAAGPIGALLGEPEVATILRVMTTSVLVIAVGSVPLALMRRRMQFRSLAFMEVVSSLVAQVVAIAAALLGAGAWALIFQLMVAQVVTTAWVLKSAKWRPRMQFSKQHFVIMGFFGLQVVGSGLAAVVREWIVTAIVIAELGTREAGYLNIAQRLVLTAQDLTASALLPVSMVAFAKVRDSPERLRSSYLRASALSHSVVTMLMTFVAVSAPVLIPFLFGHDKGESAAITPALAAAVVVNLGLMIDQGLHYGMGRPARWFALVIVTYSVTIAFTAFAVDYGLETLAIAWVVAGVVELIGRWFVVGSLIKLPAWRVAMPVLAVIPPAAIAVGSGLVGIRLLDGQPEVLVLAVLGVFVVGLYLIVVRVLQPATFSDALSVLPGRLSRPVRRLFRQPVIATGAELS